MHLKCTFRMIETVVYYRAKTRVVNSSLGKLYHRPTLCLGAMCYDRMIQYSVQAKVKLREQHTVIIHSKYIHFEYTNGCRYETA